MRAAHQAEGLDEPVARLGLRDAEQGALEAEATWSGAGSDHCSSVRWASIPPNPPSATIDTSRPMVSKRGSRDASAHAACSRRKPRSIREQVGEHDIRLLVDRPARRRASRRSRRAGRRPARRHCSTRIVRAPPSRLASKARSSASRSASTSRSASRTASRLVKIPMKIPPFRWQRARPIRCTTNR